MLIKFENYRQFYTSRNVFYVEAPTVTTEKPAVPREASHEVPTEESIQRDLEQFEKEHGEDAFRKIMEAEAEKIIEELSKGQSEERIKNLKNRMKKGVENSVNRFRLSHPKIKSKLEASLRQAKKNYDLKIKEDLSESKSHIIKAKDAIEKKVKIERREIEHHSSQSKEMKEMRKWVIDVIIKGIDQYHLEDKFISFVSQSIAPAKNYAEAKKNFIKRLNEDVYYKNEENEAFDNKVREFLKSIDPNEFLPVPNFSKIEIETPSLENQEAVDKYFSHYLEVLKAKYLDSEILRENTPQKIRLGNLQKKMERWVQSRLNVLKSMGNANQTHLKYLKDEIAARYQKYASFDGDPSTISRGDLDKLEASVNLQGQAAEEFIKKAEGKFGTADYKSVTGNLEDFRLLNPEQWKDRVLFLGENLIKETIDDKAEDKFIAVVNEKIEPVKNFKEAKKAFLKRLDRMSQANAQEALQFIEMISGRVFDTTIKAEAKAEYKLQGESKDAFSKQVSLQLDYLLSGATEPKTQIDITLVTFMRADRNEREKILSRPKSKALLAEAIGTITKGYPDVLRVRFGVMPKKVTHSRHLAKPTSHDEAARLKALIILGEQAKGIVQNFDQGLMKKIEETKVQPNTIKLGLNFKVPGDTTTMRGGRYISSIERGGFNGRDLGLKAMKLLGVATVLMNFANSWSGTKQEGDNIAIHLGKALKNMATNPMAHLGVGAVLLSEKAEKDPRYLKWFWLSEYEKQDVRTADLLETIGKKDSEQHRDRLLANPAEWKIAKAFMKTENRGKLTAMMNRARKEGGRLPRMTDYMLKTGGVLNQNDPADQGLLAQINDPNLARSRYLFYEYFLEGAQNTTTVEDIKEHCTGSRFIS